MNGVADDPRSNADDLREAARLVVRATIGVTHVVEAMHLRIAGGPAVLGSPLALPARLGTAVAYGNVRLVTRLVGELADRVLQQLTPVLGESTQSAEREAIISALNGVIGDWLAHTHSPLAVDMQLRRAGAGPKVVVLVHGSAMSDRQWLRRSHDHGAALARDDGWAPVYVRYNSGLPIAENGRKLARLLDELADSRDIALIGHSMGGLVARSACHAAEVEGRVWRTKLRTLVTLGSPHLGAPLERAGNLVEILLPISSYSEPLARLGKIRSKGITDLRHGLRLPLPAGVDCHAIAAENDRLVPVQSAHGSFPPANCSIAPGVSHLDLLCCPNTYRIVRGALASGILPS